MQKAPLDALIGRSRGLRPIAGRAEPLIRLPAQEGGDVQLVFLHRIMHRSGPAVLVEPLMRGPAGILGDRFGAG